MVAKSNTKCRKGLNSRAGTHARVIYSPANIRKGSFFTCSKYDSLIRGKYTQILLYFLCAK